MHLCWESKTNLYPVLICFGMWIRGTPKVPSNPRCSVILQPCGRSKEKPDRWNTAFFGVFLRMLLFKLWFNNPAWKKTAQLEPRGITEYPELERILRDHQAQSSMFTGKCGNVQMWLQVKSKLEQELGTGHGTQCSGMVTRWGWVRDWIRWSWRAFPTLSIL